jgi:hypothetical protein
LGCFWGGAGLLKGGAGLGPKMLPPGYEEGHRGGEAAAGEPRSMARNSEAIARFLVWQAAYE